jgi:pyruvate, water dikinase
MKKKISLFPFRKPANRIPSKDYLALLFRYKYSSFKMLLDSNTEFLKVITDLEEKLRGRQVFGMSYVRTQSDKAIFHVLRMVKNLDDLSNHCYGQLFEVLEKIKSKIHMELGQKKESPSADLTLDYSRINKESVDWVGGKNANLGEIAGQLHLPTPEGFAVTTSAFSLFLAHNGLFEEINAKKMEIDPADPESIQQASREIQQLILSAQIPAQVEEAIQKAYDEMVHRLHRAGSKDSFPKVAMRSSAIGEDSELSFAGQYLSVLNVSPNQLMDAYKQVVASLYTPRAMAYRLNKGIRDEDIAMSVACLQMIDASASGIIYTHHPFNLLEDHISITAVWGLGPYAVEGRITPDSYTVSKDSSHDILVTAISHKPVQLINDPKGGIKETAVPAENQDIPCLPPGQITTLAEYALKLEKHHKGPQDIEWALDTSGRLMILQSRPLHLRLSDSGPRSIPRIPNYPLLVEDGAVAFPGIGFGPAFQIHSDEDLTRFPEGAVLVAKHSLPQFVMVMKRAQAILTDLGSITGHMASLAREFAVPCILDTRVATSAIPTGMEITVDAYSGRVYKGKVSELLSFQKSPISPMRDTPVYQSLRRAADLIVPLYLTDPKAANFGPEFCQTLHDIGRLVHERSYSEMFQLSDLVSGKEGFAYKLEARIPLDLHLIDLGEGLIASKAQEVLKKVPVEAVVSLPFKALLRGMTHEAFQCPQLKPVSFSGFFSVMREQMMAPPQTVERFGDRSYAIISDKYLNFSSRVGYHYSVLDAYCSPMVHMNYIAFSFKGGAADDTRRNRRARAVALILQRMDFVVEAKGDRVDARFQKYEGPLIEEKLDQLGRLLLYTRQMDMLMHSETSVEAVAGNFLEGNYKLEQFQ